MNNPTIEATLLGVDFYIETYPVDGWQVRLTDASGNDLYNKRVIADTLYEAVSGAVWAVWGEEMDKVQEYDLPNSICRWLDIEEPTFEEPDWEEEA